jgi:predicted nucleic acid-binding protein
MGRTAVPIFVDTSILIYALGTKRRQQQAAQSWLARCWQEREIDRA